MALKNCKECGNQISSKAEKCPHCGTPVKRKPIKLGCIGAIVIIFIVGFIASQFENWTAEKRANEQKAQKREIESRKKQKAENLFKNNIEDHYKKMVESYESGNIDLSFNELKKFQQYKKLDYKDVATKYQKPITIAHLEKKVKAIPAAKYSENLEIYSQLAKLNPKNDRYQKKIAFYKNKIKEKKRIEERNRKENEARVAKFGPAPERSSWDGSVYEVKKYLKRVAHDPESIEIQSCTDIYYDKNKGWLVACEYLGKNAFGATVRNANWFVIRHVQVIEVKDINAYKY